MMGKEVAKFFSGVAASQTLTHGGFALGGVEFDLLGIAHTQELNTIAAVLWALASAMLIYFGWMRT